MTSSTQRAPVLIVDDEENLRRILGREVKKMGYTTTLAPTTDEALARLEEEDFAVVILDLKLPGRPSLEVLKEIKQRWPLTEVIILTGHGSVETAIEAMRHGAYDYQQKPCHLDKLEALLAKAIEKRGLAARAEALTGAHEDGPIEWGQNEAMSRIRRDLEKAAPTDAPVLITGESGTGKELIAREIHRRSAVAGGAFVVVNCGAIPPSLAESILFGHERGAFTGADRRKLGMVEVADKGTLFLDELGEMPFDCQAKLLRFLQFGEVSRVGSVAPLRVEARIIAATNVDLDEGIRRGEFREDLLYRLETVRLELPPLRERRADIRPLIERFLRELADKGRPERSFSPEALNFLEGYAWPGNVRELRNLVERLSILGDGPVIEVDEVLDRLRIRDRGGPSLELMTFKDMERRLILLALKRFHGDKRAAAKALGIALKTLYNKIKLYEIESEDP